MAKKKSIILTVSWFPGYPIPGISKKTQRVLAEALEALEVKQRLEVQSIR